MASALQTRRSEVEAEIEAKWHETEIAWEDVPLGLDGRDDPDAPWIRVVIRWAESDVDAIGPTGVGTNRIPGVLFCNVFGKPGRGRGEVETLADTFRDLVNRKEIGSVRFGSPSGPRFAQPDGMDPARLTRSGSPGSGRSGWIQATVTTPFEVLETI